MGAGTAGGICAEDNAPSARKAAGAVGNPADALDALENGVGELEEVTVAVAKAWRDEEAGDVELLLISPSVSKEGYDPSH